MQEWRGRGQLAADSPRSVCVHFVFVFVVWFAPALLQNTTAGATGNGADCPGQAGRGKRARALRWCVDAASAARGASPLSKLPKAERKEKPDQEKKTQVRVPAEPLCWCGGTRSTAAGSLREHGDSPRSFVDKKVKATARHSALRARGPLFRR